MISIFYVSLTERKTLLSIWVNTLTGDEERFKDVFAALEKILTGLIVS